MRGADVECSIKTKEERQLGLVKLECKAGGDEIARKHGDAVEKGLAKKRIVWDGSSIDTGDNDGGQERVGVEVEAGFRRGADASWRWRVGETEGQARTWGAERGQRQQQEPEEEG